MGILTRLGKAVSKGLAELDGEVTKPETPAPVAHPEDGGAPLSFADGHADEQLTFYKRRSVEYFALIRKMEEQREEWKSLYQRDSQGHQGAQALLQEHIVGLRGYVVGLIKMVNTYRKEKGEEPIDTSKFDLKAFPVGLAEETAARNAHDLASVAPQVDARVAIDAIHAEVPVPDFATAPTEPPKNS